MKLEYPEDGTPLIKHTYSFMTEGGEHLGVCMRDGGYDISTTDKDGTLIWYHVRAGKVTPLIQPVSAIHVFGQPELLATMIGRAELIVTPVTTTPEEHKSRIEKLVLAGDNLCLAQQVINDTVMYSTNHLHDVCDQTMVELSLDDIGV